MLLHIQHLVFIFFDLGKAYDTTWRRGILIDLIGYGVRGYMLVFSRNLFRGERFFKALRGGILSQPFVQETGDPQGCILSVALFLVKVHSVFDNLTQDFFALCICQRPSGIVPEKQLDPCWAKVTTRT